LIARSLEHPRQVELAGAGPQGSEAGGRYATWKEHRTHSIASGSGLPVTLQGSRCSRPRRRPCRQRQARQPPAEGD